MKLTRVEITNFRSIKDVTINFDHSCRILVGINESGKSNILRALSFLDHETIPDKDEIREPLANEPVITESGVDFIFDFDEQEINQIYKAVEFEFLSKEKNAPIIKDENKSYTLYEFCAARSQGIYWVDLISNKKSITTWTLKNNYKLLPNWKTHIDYKKSLTSKIKSPTNCLIVNTNDAQYKNEELRPLDILEIDNIITESAKQIVKEKMPKAIFWQYDSNNLIPSSVTIESFKNDTSTCIPLKNMFNLAGISDISKAITDAQAGSSNKLPNLLDRVSQKTTEHIKDVWKDYKNIEFSLTPNGGKIEIHVKEKNRYLFSHRSDGFKRFVTFILMISSIVKNNTLKNCLLLVDEPEIGLHPSGVRDLRNELIKISKASNYVVSSTHSIFMVDADNISRHYIVTKENETTIISQADEGNLAEEEVIYKGFKFSLYEILNKKNIIFEGWRDKEMFRIAMSKLPVKYKSLKDKFKTIGICHADGVKMIKNITPLLELGNRECLVLSDEDETAKQHKAEYLKLKIHGKWKTYSEVFDSSIAITGEDFIKDNTIIKALSIVKKSNNTLSQVDNPSLSHPKGKIYAIKEWLQKSGINNKDEKEKIVSELKHHIFENLTNSDIEDTYYEYLNNVGDLV